LEAVEFVGYGGDGCCYDRLNGMLVS
jgi:hypothetical protein